MQQLAVVLIKADDSDKSGDKAADANSLLTLHFNCHCRDRRQRWSSVILIFVSYLSEPELKGLKDCYENIGNNLWRRRNALAWSQMDS